jgi:hypothetical protein
MPGGLWGYQGKSAVASTNLSAKTIPYDRLTSGCTAIETQNQGGRVSRHLSCNFLREDPHTLLLPARFLLVQVRNRP